MHPRPKTIQPLTPGDVDEVHLIRYNNQWYSREKDDIGSLVVQSSLVSTVHTLAKGDTMTLAQDLVLAIHEGSVAATACKA